MKHHITSPLDNVTACRRRIVNRLDPMPDGDTLTREWEKVDCPACLSTLPPGQPPVPSGTGHDKRKSPAEWVHDCEGCIYLDTVTKGGPVIDLYVHAEGPGATVIARYGNDGGDYRSGIAFASRDPFLALALVLALKRGLIKFEDALRRL